MPKDERRSSFYYDSGVDDRNKYMQRMKKAKKVKHEDFGSQNVDVKDYILSPEGWEGIMFFIYFLSIPYLVGALFIFLFIAHGSFSNLFVLDMTAFFIIWAIGYEVIASLLLVVIIISYIKYISRSSKE